MTITPKKLAEIIRPFCKEDPNNATHGKLDFIIVFSGFAGVGKSTANIILGKVYSPRGFSYERNLIYSKKALLEMLSKEHGGFIGVDEAINVLFKREFFEHDQISILKDIDTYRSNHNVVSLLIPSFWDLDSKLLNSGRIKLWVYCKRWGEAIIMKPINKMFNKDPWNFELNQKLEAKGMIYASPNYVDTMIWHELPKDEYAKYDEVRIRKRQEAVEERAVKDNLSSKQKSLMKVRNALVKLCLKYGIHNKEVSEASGMAPAAISRITHSAGPEVPPEV
jgi:hypothetical protein